MSGNVFLWKSYAVCCFFWSVQPISGQARKLFLRTSYAVCSFFGFVHRLGFKILNWEPKPNSNPRRRPPGGPLTLHCTGPLRPNGQTLAHASSSCGWGMSRPRHAYVSADFRRWNWKTPGQAYSHFTPEILTSRYIAIAWARCFPRAQNARHSAATALCRSARRSGTRAPLSGSGTPPSRPRAPVRRKFMRRPPPVVSFCPFREGGGASKHSLLRATCTLPPSPEARERTTGGGVRA